VQIPRKGTFEIFSGVSIFRAFPFSVGKFFIEQEATTSSDTSGSFITINQEYSPTKFVEQRQKTYSSLSPTHWMSEERRLKINQIRNNLEALLTLAETFKEKIEELIKFNGPEGRDLSIAMTVLEQALYYIGQLNWRLTNVNRSIVPHPDAYESQLVTWTR
jgi:hypothetical protein